MPGSFDDRGHLEWADGRIITCLGKKRSGKSVMGLVVFRSYPWDKVVIDVAGDDGPWGPGVVQLHGTVEDLPRRLPEDDRPEIGGRPAPMIWRYVPDAGSPTFLDDMDHVIGLGLAHGKRSGHCAVLVHEGGVLAQANRTKMHTRRSLMHNRHNGATLIFCMPRSQTIDPLIIMQSDLVYIFDLPQIDDRKRVAENIGWPVKDFDQAWSALRTHEYLRYDANQARPYTPNEHDYRLVHWEALPEDVVSSTLAWAHGGAGQGPIHR